VLRQLSVASFQLSENRAFWQLATRFSVSCRMGERSATHPTPLTAKELRNFFGNWQLATGNWQLATGNRQLA
jgi:hypothetical protein